MNDELQKQIAEILKKALEAAQKGGEWIGGQIPDALHQLIVWTIVKGGFGLLGILAYVLALIYIVPRQWKWVQDDEKYGDRGLTYIHFAFASLLMLVPVGICISLAADAAQAIFAPKLFLLEYAAHLVK